MSERSPRTQAGRQGPTVLPGERTLPQHRTAGRSVRWAVRRPADRQGGWSRWGGRSESDSSHKPPGPVKTSTFPHARRAPLSRGSDGRQRDSKHWKASGTNRAQCAQGDPRQERGGKEAKRKRRKGREGRRQDEREAPKRKEQGGSKQEEAGEQDKQREAREGNKAKRKQGGRGERQECSSKGESEESEPLCVNHGLWEPRQAQEQPSWHP